MRWLAGLVVYTVLLCASLHTRTSASLKQKHVSTIRQMTSRAKIYQALPTHF